MRIVKSYLHGFTLGTNSYEAGAKRPRGERGQVGGWSHGSTSRNIAFLRSVDETLLDGAGLALTLTVRDCPSTSILCYPFVIRLLSVIRYPLLSRCYHDYFNYCCSRFW